jgi:CDP-glucose 4,6-dehydratase
VEGVGLNRSFWSTKRVLITGNSGFKGSWLSLWLADCGAAVTGYSLAPPTTPSLFEVAGVAGVTNSIEGDVRDLVHLRRVIGEAAPDVIVHMAAQSIVREGYADPVTTYATNVLGTVHVLEAARHSTAQAVLVVTSDKCYDNQESAGPYREHDRLGGRDPYSSSKACAELVTSAYRSSYFSEGPAVASVRAGNVLGGGDWAPDRLVPDLIRALEEGRAAVIRNPDSIRPWQHVLEPLNGYLMLAERLFDDRTVAGAWNFGPAETDVRPVSWIAEQLRARGAGGRGQENLGTSTSTPAPRALPPAPSFHEAHTLKLDSTKARQQLGWAPRLPLQDALQWTVEWHREFQNVGRGFSPPPGRGGGGGTFARDLTLRQIARYESLNP